MSKNGDTLVLGKGRAAVHRFDVPLWGLWGAQIVI